MAVCRRINRELNTSLIFVTQYSYFFCAQTIDFYLQGVQKVTQLMAYLKSSFPGCVISKRLWPPRSPDLCPPDFFLWGYLKDTVYSNPPHTHTHTLQELQANIQRTVDGISTGTLKNVFANMIRRVHLCEERNGGHFQHLL
jgi:hypothetical protein